MRYIVQFADRTHMIVPESEGKALGEAIHAGKSVTFRGAYINPRFISIIKPIHKSWCKAEYVEQQERAELASPNDVKFIEAPTPQTE